VNAEEKGKYILQILGGEEKFGLFKTGAEVLATIDGLIELLDQETFPTNELSRPESPDGRTKSFTAMYPYRVAMVRYLGPWLEPHEITLPTTLSWKVYEALANYCESKPE
jgi:hypothetical protein